MTAIAAGRPDSHVAVAGWRVDAAPGRGGLTRITRAGGDLHIRVGDRARDERPGTARRAHLRSMLVADLFADGTVQLVTRCSPPALVVSRSGVALLPADGRTSARALLEPDDLLVMCSAVALDAHPAGVVDLLKAGPDLARSTDTERLVRELVHGSPDAAAAVVRRLTPHAETTARGG